MNKEDLGSDPINPVTYLDENEVVRCDQKGLTKREYFAGLAMQAMISSKYISDFCGGYETGSDKGLASISKNAIEYADALLKELSK